MVTYQDLEIIHGTLPMQAHEEHGRDDQEMGHDLVQGVMPYDCGFSHGAWNPRQSALG